jgi:pimeloyl-ACP methyl ester carboxylesterase
MPAVDEPTSTDEPAPLRVGSVPALPTGDVGAASEAAYAVWCADTWNPTDLDEWWSAATAEEEDAPYFGAMQTYKGVACASWSLDSPGRYDGPYGVAVTAPILVASTEFDPATPYEEAEAVANRFPNAHLITLAAPGHTTEASPSACVKEAVSNYLITAVLPAVSTCQPDNPNPFLAAAPADLPLEP